MTLDERLKSQILSHASQDSEREICGLILETKFGKEYFPCRNAAENPYDYFAIDPDDWIIAEEGGAEVIAIVHSHVNNKPFLSNADRIGQLQTGLPWVLVCNNDLQVFECRPRLIGRPFVYGKQDCCALCRDALHLCGVNLPDPVRVGLDEDTKTQELLTHLPIYGFEKVERKDITAGDVVLFSIGGDANHVGLYLGQDIILHHLTDRPSRREHFGGYLQSRVHSLWRHKCLNTENLEAVWNDMEI